MNTIWTRQFWVNTLELALRGAGSGAVLGMGQAPFNAWHVDWSTVSGFTAGGALVSLGLSLSAVKLGVKGSPLISRPAAGHGWNPVDPNPMG